MTLGWRQELRPGLALREIVIQATASLISMDAERLEELARCCAELNRGAAELDGIDVQSNVAASEDLELRRALEQMAKDLKLLDRVLYETKANLTVLTRLHSIRLLDISMVQSSLKHQANHDPVGDLPWVEDNYGNN